VLKLAFKQLLHRNTPISDKEHITCLHRVEKFLLSDLSILPKAILVDFHVQSTLLQVTVQLDDPFVYLRLSWCDKSNLLLG
jgi:hypothetical protein